MWLLMVTMLATLDMSKQTDEYGKTIEPVIQFNDSVFRCVVLGALSIRNSYFLPHRTPSPFKCSLRPRSEQAVRLIQQNVSIS